MPNSPVHVPIDRRQVIKGTGLAALTIMTPLGRMTPVTAQAAQTPLSILTAAEARTLESLAETLVPGATAAGVARFVDAELGSNHPLLTILYLDYVGDLPAFYKETFAALDSQAQARSQPSFADLPAAERSDLAGQLFAGTAPGWSGPPQFFVYFASRSDAIDVVFGTPDGFSKLNIPYMPHIAPPEAWS